MTDENKNKKYDQILPGTEDWPIVKLSKNQKEFVEEVINRSFELITESKNTEELINELEHTLFREKQRIKESPWEVDPPDDAKFWNDIKKQLINVDLGKDMLREQNAEKILRQILTRYANEILSSFKESSYKIARKVISFGMRSLLNASKDGIFSTFSKKYDLIDKIRIEGEIEQLRNLTKIGTVVILPTHYSNLDSILIGWVLQHLGLPPFIYGAGLNLFNIEILAYFMNSLGAYKVDRRKRNYIYFKALTSYSSLAIERGCHSIFFPGGTRSRSGKIETNLKLGLMGSAMNAMRRNFETIGYDKSKKIFVVPMALNYNFVLEAPGLIKDHLKKVGQERFYDGNDAYSSSTKLIKFLIKFITKGSSISVTFGKGMDLFGNLVDEEGSSRDQNNRHISTVEYFLKNGEIKRDDQRDYQYTKILGEKVIQSYHQISEIFDSHVVAYVTFRIIIKQYPKEDLYSLLRLPEEDISIPYQLFYTRVNMLVKEILARSARGEMNASPTLKLSTDKLIENGIENVGMYHPTRPVAKNAEGDIITENLKLLLYYHNKLDGFELKHII